MLLAIAHAGLFLNLFNLLPLSPLDGGRITAVISPRIWFIGASLMLAITLYRPSPALILICIVSLPQIMQAWRPDPKAPGNVAYYGVVAQTKARIRRRLSRAHRLSRRHDLRAARDARRDTTRLTSNV